MKYQMRAGAAARPETSSADLGACLLKSDIEFTPPARNRRAHPRQFPLRRPGSCPLQLRVFNSVGRPECLHSFDGTCKQPCGRICFQSHAISCQFAGFPIQSPFTFHFSSLLAAATQTALFEAAFLFPISTSKACLDAAKKRNLGLVCV